MLELVAYYRVSTQMQGAHGLGMAAQKATVARFAAERKATIIAEYEEVETAKRETLQNRPQLSQALAHAKRARAILVIARFDRFARNVLVTAQLMESGVEFIACDNPHANRMTIQIIAVMAEQESRLISERTRAALAARKARGLSNGPGRLFTEEQSAKGRLAAAESHRRRAFEAYRYVTPLLLRMRSQGATLREIVQNLTIRGERNQYGRPFDVQCVRNILEREGAPRLPHFLARTGPHVEKVRQAGLAAALNANFKRRAEALSSARPVAREFLATGRKRREIADELNARGAEDVARPAMDGSRNCAAF